MHVYKGLAIYVLGEHEAGDQILVSVHSFDGRTIDGKMALLREWLESEGVEFDLHRIFLRGVAPVRAVNDKLVKRYDYRVFLKSGLDALTEAVS